MHAIEYITLGEAAKLAPGRPSTNCIWRWCRKGVLARNGERIRLQHVRIGGKIYTSSESLRDFGLRLADADVRHFELDVSPSPSSPHKCKGTDRQREAAIEHAERELRERGV